jgi:hypothetical protein
MGEANRGGYICTFFVWGAFRELAPFEEVAPHSMVVWYVRDDRTTNR